jgi:queuine/archaeosine tRNA-ribosyltransferase
VSQVLADASRKRVALSVDRTAKWLDECVERLQAMQKRQAAAVAGASQQQPEPQQEAASASGRDAGAAAEQPAKRQRRDGCGSDAAGGPPLEAPLLLAPVMGGASVEERARAAKGVADKPVAGAVLETFGWRPASPMQRTC